MDFSRDLLRPSQIVYSSRKTLSLIIKPNGDLVVRSPKKLSEQAILDFVSTKSTWIIKHRTKIFEGHQAEPTLNCHSGEWVDWKGQKLELIHNQNQVKRVLLDQVGKKLIVNPLLGEVKNNLRKWLFEQARVVFTEELRICSQIMKLQYASFRLSSAISRWGSCSSKNTICLNWRLILVPPEILNYVIVHELAHIKHKNHSKEFWKLVESFDPAWKAHRAWLKQNGHHLIHKYQLFT